MLPGAGRGETGGQAPASTTSQFFATSAGMARLMAPPARPSSCRLSAKVSSQAALRRPCRCRIIPDSGSSESAGKPGSVENGHSSGTHVAMRLLRFTRKRTRAVCRATRLPPYSTLLQAGFTLPPVLPPARCALTAPFHPYRARRRGGVFSVALSMGSRPPGVTWRPALWSPDCPLCNHSDRLADSRVA